MMGMKLACRQDDAHWEFVWMGMGESGEGMMVVGCV